MLGIFLVYYIGKQFYELAEKFKKNKWLYAVLGVISYYGGTFIAGLFIGIVSEFGYIPSIDNIGELVLSLIALPFGVLACWSLYAILKNNWSKTRISKALYSEEVIDGDLM